MTNHNTQDHGPGEKCPNKSKGKSTPKTSGSLGSKKKSSEKGKGKGKEKVKEGLNVLSIVELLIC